MAAALHPGLWIVGLIGLAGLTILAPNPILILILVLGALDVWHRWSTRKSVAGLEYYRVERWQKGVVAGLYGYADELIADRGRELRDDFVSTLVEAHHGEDRLSADELRVSLVLLIFGGMDTTRNQLGLAMQSFLGLPDQWRLLAERPELAGEAVEEVMRLNPTVTWVTREATEDFIFQGLEIEEGTTIHLFSQSAGSDPRVFEEPGFDMTAERPRHFGFGGGRHHCIGHFVARMDMSEALALLARRLRDPRVDGEVKSLPRSGNTGPIELPIAFTAAPR